ncbi:MAG: acetyl-CoA carboxylase biotin carboxylase subunit [Vicinamibacterales bacterium]|nr:acetyl-CoA carboxylase biotin carboxylase subunit [Vicinamibacterales bacterium]
MKILVANRGEIAVRVLRACREMGLPSVAVYSECDRTAPHVRQADEAIAIGPSAAAESYLNVERILDAAGQTGATAIHPGYGFLAENAVFARACRDAGLVFIGPDADVIETMGGKTAARRAAIDAGVPVVPGTESLPETLSEDDLRARADEVGYPLFIKAVAGGGGRGMRRVADVDGVVAGVESARSEAGSAFGESTVYFERVVEGARHVEVQVLGDANGTVVPFVERECSIQRRHQKVIEESPSVAVTSEVRAALAEAAVALSSAVTYESAGTLEFLLDADGHFYFLEMNTRLQVEHPVTEMVTGVDLVQWQLRIARGEPLTIDRERALTPEGHAIECRVYAEDPDAGFMPAPGRITALRGPSGPGIRDDSGVEAGFEVPVFYDSMISKVIAWAPNRGGAIARMRRALIDYELGGITTAIPALLWVLGHDAFVSGRFDTTFLDRALARRQGLSFSDTPAETTDLVVMAAALFGYFSGADTQRMGADGTGPTPWRRAARLDGLQR